MSGYVISCSESLCMLHAFHDFAPDGYAVIRLNDVTQVRCGDREKQWDHMLAEEGLLEGLRNPPSIDLTSMQKVVASAHQHLGRMILECEDQEEPIQDFYIGKAIDLTEHAVLFHDFDAMGQWNSAASEVEYREITMVELETPYIQIFWRHLSSRPQL